MHSQNSYTSESIWFLHFRTLLFLDLSTLASSISNFELAWSSIIEPNLEELHPWPLKADTAISRTRGSLSFLNTHMAVQNKPTLGRNRIFVTLAYWFDWQYLQYGKFRENMEIFYIEGNFGKKKYGSVVTQERFCLDKSLDHVPTNKVSNMIELISDESKNNTRK